MQLSWYSPVAYFFLLGVASVCARRGAIDPTREWNRAHNLFMSLVVSPVALVSVLVSWQRLCVLTGTGPLGAYFQGAADWYGEDRIMTMAFDTLRLTKFIEWIDTVWLVLRRRPLQLLHVWHHATIVLVFEAGFCSGSWAVVGIVNSCIHIVMYAYYAKVPYLFLLAKYITTCQIFHLTCGVVLSLYTLKYPCSRVDRDTGGSYSAISLMLTASYVILFLRLFHSKYKRA